MTHPASTLLDSYLDGELDPAIAGEIESHLTSCSACSEELQVAQNVRELLKHRPVHLPPEGYWAESAKAILERARQEDRIVPIEPYYREREADTRRNFVRSLISLAASIVVLFSAIYFGQSQPDGNRIVTVDGQEIILTSALIEDLNPQLGNAERHDLAVGYSLLGAPGRNGRVAVLAHLAPAPVVAVF
jgi:anti-sigma factor RsiW